MKAFVFLLAKQKTKEALAAVAATRPAQLRKQLGHYTGEKLRKIKREIESQGSILPAEVKDLMLDGEKANCALRVSMLAKTLEAKSHLEKLEALQKDFSPPEVPRRSIINLHATLIVMVDSTKYDYLQARERLQQNILMNAPKDAVVPIQLFRLERWLVRREMLCTLHAHGHQLLQPAI